MQYLRTSTNSMPAGRGRSSYRRASVSKGSIRFMPSTASGLTERACKHLRLKRRASSTSLRFLLVGPYDPHCGEYTFVAPPLGVWRLAGHLATLDVECVVFDPNCCQGEV